MVTSYVTKMILKNDSNQGGCLLCLHDTNIGSHKDYLGSLQEVNHGRYVLDLLK